MRDQVRYALICQSEGVVPIVEPDLVLTGSHTLEDAVEINVRVFLNTLLSWVEHLNTLLSWADHELAQSSRGGTVGEAPQARALATNRWPAAQQHVSSARIAGIWQA
jgi:hypothetical protein